ncbi:hypothetical protein [Arthrobacter sp.]|uniref:hypothetical protein n=1 Tax=Arthrobacter sp. TaxID=1667 RepID=UPI00281275C7|nr:hypothetical protein [Arthrobacter sp.]
MPYLAAKPGQGRSSKELRATILGWGVDLDPLDRPAVPRERMDLVSGAHWDFPDRQEEKQPRERSIEHKILPPVFGTSCPPKGFSGAVRKYAYRYSEGRAAHWLLLLAGDRIDAWESHLRSFVSMRPDNPVTETGVLSEFTSHGVSSRFGKKRADLSHQWIDPLIVAGPWMVTGGGLAIALRYLNRVRRRRR